MEGGGWGFRRSGSLSRVRRKRRQVGVGGTNSGNKNK
jgi:hypothetical protein